MNRLGEILVQAREKKGLTTQEVSHITKIQQRIIEALENSDESQLPSRPFVRGFIKSYAKVLDLDSEELLRIYDGAGDQKPPQVIEVTSNPDPILEESNHPKLFSLENILRFTVVMILMSSVTLVFVFITNYQHEREIDSAQIEQLRQNASSEDQKLAEAEAAEITALELITVDPLAQVLPAATPIDSGNSQAGPAEENGTQLNASEANKAELNTPEVVSSEPSNSVAQNSADSEPVASNQGAPAVTRPSAEDVAAVQAPVQNPEKPKEEVREPAAVPPTAESTASPSLEKARVVIRALADTKVEFEPSRLGLTARQLQAGEVFILNTQSALSIKLSQPKSVEVSVNGRVARPKDQNPSVIDIELSGNL